MRQRSKISVVPALILCIGCSHTSTNMCPTPQECNANCWTSHSGIWRSGTPAFAADMNICQQHCMAKNKGCVEPRASESPADRRRYEEGPEGFAPSYAPSRWW
jgi:hypothetical protein